MDRDKYLKHPNRRVEGVFWNDCDDWITVLYCWNFKREHTGYEEYGCGEQIGNFYTHNVTIPAGERKTTESVLVNRGRIPESLKSAACLGFHGHSEHKEKSYEELNELARTLNHILVRKDGKVICPE